MTPKEKRELLLKEKPLFRRLEILDGEGYSSDMSVIWAAYKSGSFNLKPDIPQDEFAKAMEEYFSKFGQVWIIDDVNRNFSKGRGQVGLICANNVELIIEPRFGFFKWATKRNILKSTVAFLHMIMQSHKTGICMVRTTKAQRVLPDHLKKYGLLFYMGKVSSDEYLYSLRGRAS